MNTTALMPLDPSVSPQQAARVLTIRADLLPPEIRDSRRARRTRTLIAILLVATLAVLGAWYWQAVVAKQAADDAYNETFQTLTKTRADQKTDELKALVEYQEDGETLNSELKAILTNDLSWTNMINVIRDRAEDTDPNMTINDISASLAPPGSTEAGDGQVGTLTVSGIADNKRVVADYVNELGDLEDLVNPFVTSVTKDDDGFSFTLSITITDKALCGRFSDDCPSRGK
jgi:type II secretory pathway pseudopilin PulG